MKLWKTEFHLMEVTNVSGVIWDIGHPIEKLHWFGLLPKLKKHIDFTTRSFAGAKIVKINQEEYIKHYKLLVISVTNRFPFKSKYEVVGSAREYSHLLEAENETNV